MASFLYSPETKILSWVIIWINLSYSLYKKACHKRICFPSKKGRWAVSSSQRHSSWGTSPWFGCWDSAAEWLLILRPDLPSEEKPRQAYILVKVAFGLKWTLLLSQNFWSFQENQHPHPHPLWKARFGRPLFLVFEYRIGWKKEQTKRKGRNQRGRKYIFLQT